MVTITAILSNLLGQANNTSRSIIFAAFLDFFTILIVLHTINQG